MSQVKDGIASDPGAFAAHHVPTIEFNLLFPVQIVRLQTMGSMWFVYISEGFNIR